MSVDTDCSVVSRKQDSPNQCDPQARLLELPKARRGATLIVLHLTVPLILAGKRRRDLNSESEPRRAVKRQRLQSVSGVPTGQVDYIERWLDESCPSGRTSTEDETQLLGVADAMPRKSVLPSPVDSFDRTTSTSRKSERSATSVHDSDYRQSLRYRNIYINREDPPSELMQRAKKIISRPRTSPEMDDEAARQLIKTSRRVEDEGEEVIVQQLAPGIIPAMKMVPDRRLASNADQPWSNSVPVPLDPSILTNPLPLPKPKPDLAFGYSQAAFTRNQLGTIELLVDDQFGRSFAVPDQKLRFPFLDIEFKSQAKNGTHYIATNQTAGAGAITLSGNMDLTQRSFGTEKIDYEEPQFFSVTLDHQLACVNVHWIKAPVDGGNHSFHVEGLSKHLLNDANGLRAVTRAIKNILDYGADTRLRTLCEALDAYREIVVRNREAANPQRPRRHEAQPNVHREQGRRSSELVVEETSAKNLTHTSVPRDTSANDLVTEQRTTKRNRHGPGATQNVGMSISSAAPISGSRHTFGSAGKSTSSVAPKATAPSRHTVGAGAGEPKRRIRPTQKLMNSRYHLIGNRGEEPRSRHDP